MIDCFFRFDTFCYIVYLLLTSGNKNSTYTLKMWIVFKFMNLLLLDFFNLYCLS